jgi:DNA-binding response OmpR family regulator
VKEMKQEKVLIVDDEPDVREVLSGILEDAGYEVLTAASGKEALDKLLQSGNQVPHLILLDIMMPELNGFQVLEQVREHFDIPVIMLTAKQEVTSVRDGLILGADDYVRKPFHTRELLARIQAKLRRREA